MRTKGKRESSPPDDDEEFIEKNGIIMSKR